MSDRTRENRQRRKAERLRLREEKRQTTRRNTALERRLRDEAESAREEERRQEARAEWEAVTAALEVARARQEALRERLRHERLERERQQAQERERRRQRRRAARTRHRPPRQPRSDEARPDETPPDTLQARQRARSEARDQARQKAREEARRQREERRKRPQARRPAPPVEAAPEPKVEKESEAAPQPEREAERASERRASKTLAQRLEERRAAREAKRREEREERQQTERREAERRARLREERRARRPAPERPELPPRDSPEDAEPREPLPDEERARSSQSAPRPSRETEPAPPVLQARIPAGELSGALPWLRVVGPQLLTTDDRPVTLRGVSLLGLDGGQLDPDAGFASGIAEALQALEALLAWQPTVVRLAINRDRVLSAQEGVTGWDYLAALDEVIARAAAGGAYTLLSLRRLSDDVLFGTRAGQPNLIAPQPDADAIGMWRVLGERYAEEPAVLFDLFTAPHAALADDLTGFDTSWTLWTTWVQMMVAELRLAHPRAICFVCGLDWGADLSGFPVVGTGGAPLVNLVYAAHLAPDGAASWPALRALARSHPVFISEWASGPSVLSAEQTALQLRGSGLGFAAAHWNGEVPLARARAGRVVPTPFGLVVQRTLALAEAAPAAALARPFPTPEPAAPIPLE